MMQSTDKARHFFTTLIRHGLFCGLWCMTDASNLINAVGGSVELGATPPPPVTHGSRRLPDDPFAASILLQQARGSDTHYDENHNDDDADDDVADRMNLGFQDDESSFSSSSSIRALDESGTAVQIRHAEQATERGTWVVALRLRPDTVWIWTPLSQGPSFANAWVGRPQHYLRRYHRQGHSTAPLPGRVQPLTLLPWTTYAICTGIQADAAWLIYQLRRVGQYMMERYYPSWNALTIESSSSSYQVSLHIPGHVVTFFKRLFWGQDASTSSYYYDEDEDEGLDHQGGVDQSSGPWQGQALSTWWASASSNDENQPKEASWARPLGVSTLLLHVRPPPLWASSPMASGSIRMELIGPSGVVQRCPWLVCLGQNRQELYQALQEALLDEARKVPPMGTSSSSSTFPTEAGHRQLDHEADGSSNEPRPSPDTLPTKSTDEESMEEEKRWQERILQVLRARDASSSSWLLEAITAKERGSVVRRQVMQ